MKVIVRKPSVGYLDRWLWVPKMYISVDPVKSALTHVLSDSYTGKERILYLWRETRDHLLVPRAFWDPMKLPFPVVDCRPQSYARIDFEHRITLDHRMKKVNGVNVLQPTGSKIQQKSIQALMDAQGGVLQLACGLGKTVIALYKIAGGKVPALVMCDNTNLLYQWCKEAENLLTIPGGIGIFGDGKHDWKRGLVLATYHSVANWSDTIDEEARRWFGQIFWDEGHRCLISGALLGATPIEDVVVGDWVTSYNHDNGRLERRRVRHKHVSVAKSLMCVSLVGGKQHVCTPEHPFFTRRGYILAKDLKTTDEIATINKLPEGTVQLVPEGVRAAEEVATGPRKEREECVLLPRAWCSREVSCSVEGDDSYQSEVRVGTDAQEKPDEKCYYTDESVAGTARSSALCSWRERKGNEQPTTPTSTETWMANRVCGSHAYYTGIGPSVALQDRYCRPSTNDCDRGRRESTWGTPYPSCGPEEDSIFEFTRVDRTEVLERGSDGGFGQVCPDGLVYNIEVEGNNNYIADGTLMHNCPAPLFSRTVDMFYGSRYSLTATPERDDGLHVVSTVHIGHVLYKDLTPTMIPTFAFYWSGLELDLRDPTVVNKVMDCNQEVSLSKVSGFFGQWPARLSILLDIVARSRRNGRVTLLLSNSVDEVVNLMTLFERGPSALGNLYTDIPTPTPQELGETLTPIDLSPKDVNKLEKKRASLEKQKRAAGNKSSDVTVIDAQLTQIAQTLKQYDVFRKVQNELGRRRKKYILELIAASQECGLLTYDVPHKDRQRMLETKDVIFAVTKYGKEGMNCPRLDTVILSSLFSSRNGLQQLMGRPTRPMPGKKPPILLAVVDNVGQCIGMSKKLIAHLRDWPREEGGPYEPILIGYPTTSWASKKNTTTLTDLLGQ